MTSPHGLRMTSCMNRELSGGQLSNGSSRGGCGAESPDDVSLPAGLHGSPPLAHGYGDRTLRKGPFIYRE